MMRMMRMMRMIRYRFVAVVVACLSLVAVARAQETSVGNPQDECSFSSTLEVAVPHAMILNIRTCSTGRL